MYSTEHLDDAKDDGTMQQNVKDLADAVVGRRIVSVEANQPTEGTYGRTATAVLVITLDNGKRVELLDTNDCCAYTELENFLLHPERVDHVILGVGTTDNYDTWHVYADMGDVLALSVGWSAGNAFYYGYGFDIRVKEISD